MYYDHRVGINLSFELNDPGTLTIQFLNDRLLLWQGSALLLARNCSDHRINCLEGSSNPANILSSSRIKAVAGR